MMYLVIKADTMEAAVAYAQRHFKAEGNSNIRAECTLSAREQKVWASNAWIKQAAQWFNDSGEDRAPYPNGTLLFFSADQS